MQNDNKENNRKARDAWNANAKFWDERMGEGNEFFNVLIWPAVERLLPVRPGERVLDIACGNGLTSRRIFKLGAKVIALDFSEKLLGFARNREYGLKIDYRRIDATDFNALAELGPGSFGAALCNMALMDIADISPLVKALAILLRPGGVFVFSILHPCFNNPSTVQVAELEDRDGSLETTHSAKISRYLTPFTRRGLAMPGQPNPQPYFHRPISALLAICLDAGFVLDGLEERAFPAGYAAGKTVISWTSGFSEIPPILVARMRI